MLQNSVTVWGYKIKWQYKATKLSESIKQQNYVTV